VLNKKDMIEKKSEELLINNVKKYYSDYPIDRIITTNCKSQKDDGVKKIVPTAINLIKNSNRFNRSEEKENNIMIIGVPNVGKSSLINILRNKYLKAKAASPVGAVAGITRSVMTRIKISEDPLIYVLDTPGVLTPKIKDIEQGMKLALCSCFQDHLVGVINIADYLLYILNKRKNFIYMEAMGLNEPNDDITQVLVSGAAKLNHVIQLRDFETGTLVTKPNLDLTAMKMISMFRNGEFGKFCLDNLSEINE
jgi:mitochondrial GTPase 1